MKDALLKSTAVPLKQRNYIISVFSQPVQRNENLLLHLTKYTQYFLRIVKAHNTLLSCLFFRHFASRDLASSKSIIEKYQQWHLHCCTTWWKITGCDRCSFLTVLLPTSPNLRQTQRYHLTSQFPIRFSKNILIIFVLRKAQNFSISISISISSISISIWD